MSFARDVYTASASQTDYTITFPYLDQADVLVYEDGVLQTQGSSSDYIFSNSTTIQFNSGHAGAETIILQRSTSQAARLVDYTAGPLAEADLDNDSIQAFYLVQEAIDIANTAMGRDSADEWDAESVQINNVVDPTAAQDAATKNYVDTTVDAAALGSLTTPISIANGGTAAATADAALDNLGAGTVGKAIFADTTAAAVRTELGLVIGTDVEARDADILKADVSDTLTVGMLTTSFNAGATLNSATTLHISDGNIQYGTMTGSFTLTAPDDTDDGYMELELTIDATGAYTLTLSGFNEINGTADMTANAVNLLRISKLNTNTYLEITQAV